MNMRRTLLCGCLLLLTACGFHLRGMSDIPRWLDSVALISEEQNRDLMNMLREQFESYHIPVPESPNAAHFWLLIGKETIARQITNVAASTAPRQYQLIYTVQFWLQERGGMMRIPPATVMISRQLTINNNRILGSDEEEAQIVHDMQRDAAIQIIDRLSREGSGNPPQPRPAPKSPPR